jgi:2-dehydropantoate 2-reductase
MRIAIVGAGGIGGVIAHGLARAGADMVLIARGATAAAIARDGLTVERANGVETSRPRVATDTTALGPQDLIVGALKQPDWRAALPLMVPLLGPETVVVPAINGVPWWYFQELPAPLGGTRLATLDPDGALTATLPARALLGATVYIAATRRGPAAIDWKSGSRLVLGGITATPDARLPAIARALRVGGIDIVESPDIRRDMWMKLLGNASFNPISVLTGGTMGAVRDDPDLRALCGDVMREIMAIAASLGAAPDISIDARIEMTRGMTDFRTSTLQDFEAGNPLEIAALIDAPCEIGRRVGIATPVLETLGRLVRNAVARRDAARSQARAT